MKCPKCSAENRFNAINCENCGTSLLECPADEPLDLDRFAPAHSDPLRSPEQERKIPEVSDFEPSNQDNSGDFPEKAKAVCKKIGAFIVLAAGKIWEFLKKAFAKIGQWLNAASAWTAKKIRQLTDGTDGSSDDDDGEKFRKIVLAVMLGILVVILVMLLSFCSACSSCSCSGCASPSLAGTWVESNCAMDGYDASDYIVELAADGTLTVNGISAGSYELSENMLTFTVNGMEYTGTASADAEELSVALHGYSSVTLDLLKLSDSTGLSADELADLYPYE